MKKTEIIKNTPTYKPFKPCPFCGEELLIQAYPQQWEHSHMICCGTCGGKKFVVTKYKRQLYAEWNHRAKIK